MKESLGYEARNRLTLGGAIGAYETHDNLTLALNAELIQRIVSMGGTAFQPTIIVNSTVNTKLSCEKRNAERRDKLMAITNESTINYKKFHSLIIKLLFEHDN